MNAPTFEAEPDGVHFRFAHDCWVMMKQDDGSFVRIDRGRDESTMPNDQSSGTWRITSAPGEPLTVVPSINCLNCGTHGFITDGLWVSV